MWAQDSLLVSESQQDVLALCAAHVGSSNDPAVCIQWHVSISRVRRAKRPSAPETWARKGVCPQVTWSWPGAGRFIPAGGGKRADLGTAPCSFWNGHTDGAKHFSSLRGREGNTNSWKETPRRQVEMGEWGLPEQLICCFHNTILFLAVLFLLTIFSLKVTAACKILSFRELVCGEVTRHFSSNFQTYSFFQLTNTPWSH